jgi:biotin carboxyl carrier protein
VALLAEEGVKLEKGAETLVLEVMKMEPVADPAFWTNFEN